MYKGCKSRAFLTRRVGNKRAHAKFAARLAVEKKRWNLGYRLPKIKTKTGVEDIGSECNNDKEKVGS